MSYLKIDHANFVFGKCQYFWVRLWQSNQALNLMDNVGGEQQAGGVALQQAFDIHHQGTQKEGTLRPRWHTKTHMQVCIHTYTHTHTHKTCYSRQLPSSADWAHYIPPIPFPPLPSGSWPHSGSTPSHGGPCVSIQQSEKQQHQWAHIIIHLTAPRAWHLLTALLFRLSAALLPFSLHYSAQEKGCTVRGVGACLDSRGPHPHSGSQWQTSNMIGQGRQRGVWQENNLTIQGAWSILSSVCNTRYIK